MIGNMHAESRAFVAASSLLLLCSGSGAVARSSWTALLLVESSDQVKPHAVCPKQRALQDNVLPDVIGPASEPAQAGFKRSLSHDALARACVPAACPHPLAASLGGSRNGLPGPTEAGRAEVRQVWGGGGTRAAWQCRAGASSCSRPSTGEATRLGRARAAQSLRAFGSDRPPPGTMCSWACCRSCVALARSQAPAVLSAGCGLCRAAAAACCSRLGHN